MSVCRGETGREATQRMEIATHDESRCHGPVTGISRCVENVTDRVVSIRSLR